MPTTDESSTISETKRLRISTRDGGLCVLCGDDPVDVAHIVARKAGDIGQVQFIRNISPSLVSFRKDDHTNLICLCSSHRHQYDGGHFVFVPGESQRKALLDQEHSEFAHRESLVASGQPDPGRTLPRISNEKEYIPIHPTRFHPYVHTPTPYDQTIFLFDTQDQSPCLPLHFYANPICLMVEAQPHLANVVRLKTTRADVAQLEVTMLLELYKRIPGERHNNPTTVPAVYQPANLKLQLKNLSSGSVLPTISSSLPLLPTSDSALSRPHSFGLKVPALAPSSSTSTMESEDAEIDPDMDASAQTDRQLLEYIKEEQAVTWEDLKSRPPIFPGEDGGHWQFSSAEQIIRGEWR